MKKITVQDIEDVVGFKVSNNVKALINEFDLTYSELTQSERDGVILNVINTLNDDIEYVGKHRLEKWENGWYENLELLTLIIPTFSQKRKILKYLQEFIYDKI